MLSGTYEITNKMIVMKVLVKAYEIGLECGFVYMGSTTMTTPDGRKEGDPPLKLRELRPHEYSWSTLIIECRASQSLGRLAERSIHFEKWEPVTETNTPVTHAHPDALIGTPIKTYGLVIVAGVVIGAPSFGAIVENSPTTNPPPFVAVISRILGLSKSISVFFPSTKATNPDLTPGSARLSRQVTPVETVLAAVLPVIITTTSDRLLRRGEQREKLAMEEKVQENQL
ncbi:hypothetical protein HOY80DRAFT_1044842 [Tuber brumale]|nr:hypothetical protein HOY80DRAFT_1044842 [Tuber brumale]